MFCPNCGKEVSSDALFCISCGKQLQPSTNQEQLPGNNSNGEDRVAQPRHDQRAPDTAEAKDRSTLKAAVQANKKRARRKMPMIVVLALTLALISSVAYAAYYVYTNAYLPNKQEQHEQTPEIKEESEGDQAKNEYDKIVKEYSSALREQKRGTINPNENELDEKKYPHVNSGLLIDLFIRSQDAPDEEETVCYAYKDLNKDGIDELLIGRKFEHGVLGEAMIYDMWSYANSKPINLGSGFENQCFYLRSDDILLEIIRGGLYDSTWRLLELKANPKDVSNEDTYDSFKSTWNLLGSLSFESSGSNSLSYEIAAGKQTKRNGTCSKNQFNSIRDDFLKNYPVDTSTKWVTLEEQ